MMDEEKLAEEYEEKADCVDVNDYGQKVYGSPDIEQAFLAGLKAGSQLDKVWQDYDPGEGCYEDSHEGKWVKREAGRLKWFKDKYSHNEKDKLLPCGKVEGYYRVILYDNYREPQIVNPGTEIEFAGNQREHIIAWCEIPTYIEE